MPLTLTDALGNTTTFTYSDTGRRSSVTDPMGVKTTFTYDENGNVLTQSTRVSSNGTKQNQVYAFEHGDMHHPRDMTSSIDPLGNETDYTYDSRGNLASVTDPLGNTWTYSTKKACFNKTDPRVARRAGGSTPDATVTDPLGHTTSYTCDANGNLLTTTDAHRRDDDQHVRRGQRADLQHRPRRPEDDLLLRRRRPAHRRPYAGRHDQPCHVRRRRGDQHDRRPGGRHAELHVRRARPDGDRHGPARAEDDLHVRRASAT